MGGFWNVCGAFDFLTVARCAGVQQACVEFVGELENGRGCFDQVRQRRIARVGRPNARQLSHSSCAQRMLMLPDALLSRSCRPPGDLCVNSRLGCKLIASDGFMSGSPDVCCAASICLVRAQAACDAFHGDMFKSRPEKYLAHAH